VTLDAEALALARPELAGRPGDDTELREAVRREVAAVNGLLARFEQVKEFRIVPRDFSQEAGELTFTLKLKRRVIEDAWKELLEGMYSRGAEEQA
jgi:long-chain acyl-CoA synthetase